MAFLPPSIVLSGVNHRGYFRYVQGSGEFRNFIRLDPDVHLDSPYVKMDVELSYTGEGLVHLRCTYNNRYWRRSSHSNWLLVAESREPVDDQSNLACTLFKPERVGNDGRIRFRHMQTGNYVATGDTRSPIPNSLEVSPNPGGLSFNVFNIVDWDTLVFLPKYIAFKQNGKFLIYYPNFLSFTGGDFAEKSASYEIITASNGNIFVQFDGDHSQLFWTIRQDPSSPAIQLTTVELRSPFRPFTAGKDTKDQQLIAIGTTNGNRFCRERPAHNHYYSPYLCADLPTITNEAAMEVVERVFSREIYNVRFRQLDGRIYNEQIIDSGHQTISNRGSEPVDATLTFTYTHTTSKRWEHNIHVSASVTSTIRTQIPFIAEAEISLSVEAGYAHTWGTEETTSIERSTSTVWVVPPMKRHTVHLLVTRANFDVPFSYTQRDRLTTGHIATQVRHDGVFRGLNTTKFNYEAEEEDL